MPVEFLRRISPVKRTLAFATLLIATLLLSTSCGVSDSVKSLLLTSTGTSVGGFYNLAGVDSTKQLKVYAVYHSGKQIDVTNDSTWTVVPVGCANAADDPTTLCPTVSGAQPPYMLPAYGPNTVPINKTGLMTGIAGLCTWTDAIDNTKTPPKPANPPIWEYTGYYQTTATYRNFTSQPVGIGVGVVADPDSPIGGCGPS